MAFQLIKLERQDRIAILTLNRPEKRNALSVDLVREFGDALDEVNDDHDVNDPDHRFRRTLARRTAGRRARQAATRIRRRLQRRSRY